MNDGWTMVAQPCQLTEAQITVSGALQHKDKLDDDGQLDSECNSTWRISHQQQTRRLQHEEVRNRECWVFQFCLGLV